MQVKAAASFSASTLATAMAQADQSVPEIPSPETEDPQKPLPVAKTNKCRSKQMDAQEKLNQHRLKMAAKRRFGSGTAGAWRFHLKDVE